MHVRCDPPDSHFDLDRPGRAPSSVPSLKVPLEASPRHRRILPRSCNPDLASRTWRRRDEFRNRVFLNVRSGAPTRGRVDLIDQSASWPTASGARQSLDLSVSLGYGSHTVRQCLSQQTRRSVANERADNQPHLLLGLVVDAGLQRAFAYLTAQQPS